MGLKEVQPPLWGEEVVAAMRLISAIMKSEGKEAFVVAQKHEGTPFFRCVFSGKDQFELHRRVAICMRENQDGQS